ncbi:MAG: hypothetical protein ACOCQX_04815 [Candidatus Nanoarchaeia archaeon]
MYQLLPREEKKLLEQLPVYRSKQGIFSIIIFLISVIGIIYSYNTGNPLILLFGVLLAIYPIVYFDRLLSKYRIYRKYKEIKEKGLSKKVKITGLDFDFSNEKLAYRRMKITFNDAGKKKSVEVCVKKPGKTILRDLKVDDDLVVLCSIKNPEHCIIDFEKFHQNTEKTVKAKNNGDISKIFKKKRKNYYIDFIMSLVIVFLLMATLPRLSYLGVNEGIILTFAFVGAPAMAIIYSIFKEKLMKQ